MSDWYEEGEGRTYERMNLIPTRMARWLKCARGIRRSQPARQGELNLRRSPKKVYIVSHGLQMAFQEGQEESMTRTSEGRWSEKNLFRPSHKPNDAQNGRKHNPDRFLPKM